jgi:hypothetical protein
VFPWRWARRGTRPSAPYDQRTASAYIFGTTCPKKKAAPQRRLRERTPDWRIIATAAPDDAASAAAVEPEFLFELLVRLFAGPALTYGLALEKLTGRPRAYGGTPAA